MRIFTISDLHVDYPENLSWALELSRAEYANDVLILPGDVSDDFDLLTRVLKHLQNTFAKVFFVPGNHELWIDRDHHDCSLEKFEAILALCEQLEIHTQPAVVDRVTVVPMFSWYDFSFGEPDAYLRRAWRDFKACRWPSHLPDNSAISEYFLSLNDKNLGLSGEYVISFSHFLPRIDVMPDRIPEQKRKVYPVLGGDGLGDQVRQLDPDVHVYGHSHVNRDVVVEGVRYVNNAFAYPSEQRIARKALHCVYAAANQADSKELSTGTG